MGGQPRWFHASHILMLLSMLSMFASMEFKWKWFPSSSWAVIFSVTTTVIFARVTFRYVQRRSVSFLWILALIMAAAMIYMWVPNWAPALTWTLVVYYGIETVAWLSGRLDESRPARVVGPGKYAVVGAAPQKSADTGSGVALATVRDSRPATAITAAQGTVVVLAQDSPAARASMAVMAASMAYMFAATQLMR
jgi:hypothetical protein